MSVQPGLDLPASFRRIRLELAREQGNPAGNPQFGYEIVVPLTQEGRLDAELWKEHRDRFRVVRFRPDGDRDVGHIVRRPGGSWALRYDVTGDQDQEVGYHFNDERFVIGEYVSVHDEDASHTYRVVSVEKP